MRPWWIAALFAMAACAAEHAQDEQPQASTVLTTLSPTSDVSSLGVVGQDHGTTVASNLYTLVDDSPSAPDGNKTVVILADGVASGFHKTGYDASGTAPVGKVTQVDVYYYASNGPSGSGTAQAKLFDGSTNTLVLAGQPNTLGAWTTYHDTFAGVSLARAADIAIKLQLMSSSGSTGSLRYSQIYVVATIDQTAPMTVTAADTTPQTAENDRLSAHSVPSGTDHVTFFDTFNGTTTTLGTDSASPWAYGWQVSGNTGNGAHAVTAKAYDASGSVLATSSPQAITVGIDHAMDDTQFYAPGMAGTTPFPRLTNTGGNTALGGSWVADCASSTSTCLAKFTAVNGALDSSNATLLEQLSAAAGNVIKLRYLSARAFQDATVSPPPDPAYPYGTFPGHWLLQGIATTTQPLTSAEGAWVTLATGDGKKVDKGTYVMIWDGTMNTKFNHVEHAWVADKNGDSIQLTQRGFLPAPFSGTPLSHVTGTFIATHVNGAVSSQAYWAYNMSSLCPLDGNGQRMNQVMASWIGANLQLVLDKHGNPVAGAPATGNYDGILWDISGNSLGINGNDNTNMDGSADGGYVSVGGVIHNVWGEGMDTLFSNVRAQLDGLFGAGNGYMVGGTTDTRGYASLNGDQLEGFPVQSNFEGGSPSTNGGYDTLDEQLQKYTYFMHGSMVDADATRGIRVYSECRNKTPVAAVTDLSSLRFSLGMTLLENGVYSKQTASLGADIRDWFDEFSVTTSGAAVCSSDPGGDFARMTNTGWLGLPSNVRTRVLDAMYSSSGTPTVDLGTEYLADGGFDMGTGAWTASNVSIQQDSSTHDEGTASLVAGAISGYNGNPTHAFIRSSAFATAVPAGSDCVFQGGGPGALPTGCVTVAFAAKASAVRNITVTIAGATQEVVVDPSWRRYVVVLPVAAGTTPKIEFDIGKDNVDQLWLDGVHAYAGNADVFRRDFASGTVIVNMTRRQVTVNIDANAYKRIDATAGGCQDGGTNSGQCVATSTIDIAPLDSAILFKGCP
jgi:hypothetical protein